MTRFDRALKELGNLYEMYRVIKQYKMPVPKTQARQPPKLSDDSIVAR